MKILYLKTKGKDKSETNSNEIEDTFSIESGGRLKFRNNFHSVYE